ncbi:hypothetical protein CC1G_03986 [Coprinopsis cinerea okayama7|uniref:SET domain-containing protein n=1 Tax=Coprinopsis cinerea (strain Okayama-7 / 130 / ATCC MYA-4618 / FGSC 9003) TaxID=240176 RepID=A8N8D9_COPC7|nr:hypothetical protein CC1G_03986 [Coprinopsis cinerea okayama7\|eukprot:XP_001831095.1 hypothetical protein CC1G_03986 [Coprinopsis cinerea okayama7\
MTDTSSDQLRKNFESMNLGTGKEPYEESVTEYNLPGGLVVLPKVWEKIQVRERIARVFEIALLQGQNTNQSVLWSVLVALLFRNGVPGSEGAKSLESPRQFCEMLVEWRKVAGACEELTEALQAMQSGELSESFATFGSVVVWMFSIAIGLETEKLSTASQEVQKAMIALDKLRDIIERGNTPDEAQEDDEQAASSSTTTPPTANKPRVVQMPFGNAKNENLPEDIEKRFTEFELTPVDKIPLKVKNGKVVEPDIISTYVPSAPVDESKEDPDGHTIWITSPASKAKYFAHKNWPRPLPKIRNRLVVRETGDGSGLGVFATEDIKRYEPVLVERPFLVYPIQNIFGRINSEGLSELSDNQIAQLYMKKAEGMLRYAVDQQMMSRARKGFLELGNSHLNDGSGPLLGIVRTNGFGISFGERLPGLDDEFNQGYAAIAKVGSRFNHSCTPDVVQGFDAATFSIRFTATRDIKAGSQVHVGYALTNAPKAERQKALERYGFECKCRACVHATPQSDKLRQISNKMTQTMRRQAINVWSKDRKLTEDVLKPVLEMKKRMEEEGLDTIEAGYTTIYEIMHRVYGQVGNRRKEKEVLALMMEHINGSLAEEEWRTGVKPVC